MLDFLDKLFDKAMTIAFSVGLTVFIVFSPTIDLIKTLKDHRSKLDEHEQVINDIKRDLADIKVLVVNTSGIGSFDAASKINNLEHSFTSLKEKNLEILEVLRDDPDTLATIREVNVKYDHIIKNMDKVENDIRRAEDKLFSDLQSSNGLWLAVTLFLAGFIGQKVVQVLFSNKKRGDGFE